MVAHQASTLVRGAVYSAGGGSGTVVLGNYNGVPTIQGANDSNASQVANLAINSIGGNVGIGTTTPWGRLSIKGAGTGTGKALVITDSSDVERMVVQDDGNVGIGTTGPGMKLNIVGTTGAPASSGSAQVGSLRIESATNSVLDFGNTDASPYGNWIQSENKTSLGITYPLLLSPNGGNVGIGTTSPSTFKLQVKGDIGPDANNTYILGSASLAWGCLYYNASVLGTCPSDQRLKDNVADLSFGSDPLSQIAGLRLRTFNYKSAPGSTYSGLVAQEVEAVAPELVVTDPR